MDGTNQRPIYSEVAKATETQQQVEDPGFKPRQFQRPLPSLEYNKFSRWKVSQKSAFFFLIIFMHVYFPILIEDYFLEC